MTLYFSQPTIFFLRWSYDIYSYYIHMTYDIYIYIYIIYIHIYDIYDIYDVCIYLIICSVYRV